VDMGQCSLVLHPRHLTLETSGVDRKRSSKVDSDVENKLELNIEYKNKRKEKGRECDTRPFKRFIRGPYSLTEYDYMLAVE